jgi:hypothetical protein
MHTEGVSDSENHADTTDEEGGIESDEESDKETTTYSSYEEYKDPWEKVIDVSFNKRQTEFEEKVQSYIDSFSSDYF